MDSQAPQFKVRFAHSREEAQRGLQPMTVVIYPHSDRWDDLGYKLSAAAVIQTHVQIVEINHLAFLSAVSRDSRESISARVGNLPFREASNLIPNDGGGSAGWWVTILDDLYAYRNLVGRMGLPDTVAVLKAIHDIPALSLESKPEPWYGAALASDGFRFGLLRAPQRYFAYRRAADILSGNEKGGIELSSAKATLQFKLLTFANKHVIRFEFQPTKYFDHRIHVLIGENGVGKSQALSHIVDALAKGGSSPSQFFSDGQFSRVIAFSGIPSQKSLPRKLRNSRYLQYRFFDLSPSRPPARQSNPLTTALLDLIRDAEQIGGERRVQMLSKAVESWMPLAAIALPLKYAADEIVSPTSETQVRPDHVAVGALIGMATQQSLRFISSVDIFAPPVFIHSNGKSAPLSSGQELFFRFALNLCCWLEVGTLVLVDEPENHLHPNFVSRLISLLREFLVMTGSFAILASHSPFVVREVSRRDVSILSRQEDGTPLVRQPRLQTLGASVSAVSSYVFGDELLPTLARLTADTIAMSGANTAGDADPALLDELKDDFSFEAVSHIRAEIGQRDAGGGNTP